MKFFRSTWRWMVSNTTYVASISALLSMIAWLINIVLVERSKAQQQKLSGVVQMRNDGDMRDTLLMGQSNTEKQLTRIEQRQNELIGKIQSERIKSARHDEDPWNDPDSESINEEQWEKIVWAIQRVEWASQNRQDCVRTGRYASAVKGMTRLVTLPRSKRNEIFEAIEESRNRSQKISDERQRHENEVRLILGKYSISRHIPKEKYQDLILELERHSKKSKSIHVGNLETMNKLHRAAREVEKHAAKLKKRSELWSGVWFFISAIFTLVGSCLTIIAKFYEAKNKSRDESKSPEKNAIVGSNE